MASQFIQTQDDNERLFLEQALAMYRESCRVSDEAPDGEVFDRTEEFVGPAGRKLMAKAMELVLSNQAEAVEKKGRPNGSA